MSKWSSKTNFLKSVTNTELSDNYSINFHPLNLDILFFVSQSCPMDWVQTLTSLLSGWLCEESDIYISLMIKNYKS